MLNRPKITAPNESELLELTAELVSAYVGHNPVPLADLPKLIVDVHAALAGLGGKPVAEAVPDVQQPAVPIKKSVMPDYLVSLESGERFKSLTRHLSSRYGMTPDDYRRKWGLPADYPMVAPAYSAKRSELAKSLGLGRKPGKMVSRKVKD